MSSKENLKIRTTVNAPVEKVWQFWTLPEHITHWNYASDDWYTPKAENELRKGGKFNYRMEAKDGSMGFDFEGIYDAIKVNELIEYTIADGRKVNIVFSGTTDKTQIVETFEAEDTNPVEMQRDGWQAILNNFKKYAESIN